MSDTVPEYIPFVGLVNGVRAANGQPVSVRTAIEAVITGISPHIGIGRLDQQTDVVRSAIGRPDYSTLKEKLPAIQWAGNFGNGRAKADFQQATGILGLDYDHLPDIEQAIADAAAHPATFFIYRTISGQGLRIVPRMNPSHWNTDTYTQAWEAAVSVYNKQLGAETSIDNSTKDISRLSFLAYDPAAFLRSFEEVIPLNWPLPASTALVTGNSNPSVGTTRPSRAESHPQTPNTSDLERSLFPPIADAESEAPKDAPFDESESIAGLSLSQWVEFINGGGYDHREYGQWAVDTGMALFHSDADTLNGKGFWIWRQWSMQEGGEWPGDSEGQRKWNSFRTDSSNHRSIGSLIQAARERNYRGAFPQKSENVLEKNTGEDGPPNPESARVWYAGNPAHHAKRMLEYAPDRMLVVTDFPMADREYGGNQAVTDAIVMAVGKDSAVWRRDNAAIRNYYYNSLADYGYFIKQQVGSVKQKTEAWKLLDRAETSAGLNEAKRNVGRGIKLLEWENSPVLPRNRGSLSIGKYEDLDREGRYLGCGNGVVVDLETGEALPTEIGRGMLVTRATNIAFRPEAEDWAVEKLTSHLDPEVAEYLWGALGRTLWRQPEKALLILYGPGSSGKTTLLSAVHAALGTEAGTISADVLRPTRGEKTGPTPELQPLVECRIVSGEEAENWRIDGAKLKARTGGGWISYQAKYQPEEKRALRATIILAANELPRLGLADDAIKGRIRIVPYPKPPAPDPAVKASFDPGSIRTEAAEAMLTKLIKYASSHKPTAGKEIAPSAVMVRELDEAVSSETLGFAEWLKAAVVKDITGQEAIHVNEIWQAWGEVNGITETEKEYIQGIQKRTLTRIFREAFGAEAPENFRKRGINQRGWKGYRLMEP